MRIFAWTALARRSANQEEQGGLRGVVAACIAATLLAGCGGWQPSSMPSRPGDVLPAAEARETTYKVIYSFQGDPDGQDPSSIGSFSGSLMGTTFDGGAKGRGAVFESTSGKTHLVYSFTGGKDGAEPEGGLTRVKERFYGATAAGGTAGCIGGCGTIYTVGSNGTERVLHRLKADKSEGWRPITKLVYLNGSLYGSAGFSAGAQCYDGCGTIFSVTSSGKFHVIYRFKNAGDGCYPYTLIASKELLYGITSSGGASGCNPGVGGTVFSLTPSGKKKTLYEFKGKSDGASPTSLIMRNGVLYGTALSAASGYGIVFSLTLSGKEKVLHTFQGGSDGAGPNALTFLDNRLFGTTNEGGIGPGGGYGTLFAMTLSGRKTTLREFKGRPDGLDPHAITVLGDVLYGVTASGGASETSACGAEGCGTIYRISP